MLLKTKRQIEVELGKSIDLDEFQEVDTYLEILGNLEDVDNCSIDSGEMISEIMEDIVYFGEKAKYYMFFTIEKINGVEFYKIYDYTDEEDNSTKNGENFTLISLKDIYKLTHYQNRIL